MGDFHYHVEETHCELCGADFDSRDLLMRHEATIHPGSWS